MSIETIKLILSAGFWKYLIAESIILLLLPFGFVDICCILAKRTPESQKED